MPGGAPTDYTKELADRICETVATSTLGTNKLCVIHHDWMPSQDTIYKWRYRHQEFAEKYAEAKRKQAELMAEEILDIADDGSNDTYVDDDGNVTINHDVVARSRLRVDTRKWVACKLLPKVYGEKKNEDTNGDDQKSLMQKLIDKL